MPNIGPKQQLKDLQEKVKKSGLDIKVVSPTEIRINLPKSENLSKSNNCFSI